MQYLMAPLEEHYDGGFGATAEVFFRAAEVLSKQKGPHVFFEHLPHNFLLRHAIELFLKSGIVIIHRKLKLPFGPEPSTSHPMVQVEDEWKPFHKVHSIADLYAHWKTIITTHEGRLQTLCRHEAPWSVPEGLDIWIGTIEKADPGSTYYRYPVTRDPEADKKKSLFKEVPVEELLPENRPKDRWIRALAVQNEAGEIVRAFSLDYPAEKETTEHLVAAANTLNNYHAMMRIELTGGW